MKKIINITSILLLASFIRLYQLSGLPISLFGDEIDVGYHAWSLWTTGRDYMGHFLPTYIQSLAEWRAPLLMYFTAPFVGLLGPSTVSVRLFPALMGILNIYLVHSLCKILFPKSKSIPLSAAFLLAVTPWHIHYSRAAFEVTLLLNLILGGVIFYLKDKLSLSFILFALTFYTYSTANIFVPLLVLGILVIYPHKIKTIASSAVFASILCLPIAYNLFFGEVSTRFGLVSIFQDFKVTEEVVINRTEPWVTQGLVESIFHNKYLVYTTNFIHNYLTSFSSQFLFISGDPNFRHSIGGFGEFLWPVALLVPFIFVYFYKNKLTKSHKLLLWWLAISPVASSLTVGGGSHSTRLFVMLPALVIIFSFGFIMLKYLPRVIFVGLMFLVLFTYWHRYSHHYRFLSAKQWNYGYKQIFTQLSALQGNFKNIFINNTYQPSLISYAFYSKLPPANFQKMFHGDKVVDGIYPEFNGFIFSDHIYFGEAVGPFVIDHVTKDNGIYLSAQGREAPGNWDWIKDAPGGTKSLGGVYTPMGEPLFHLLTQFENPILKTLE